MTSIALDTAFDGIVTIRLTGRLDAFGIRDVRGRFDALIANGSTRFVIDLSAVGFLDSAGLAAIVRLVRAARLRGGDVILVGADAPDVARTFELTGMDALIERTNTITDAMAVLA